MSFVRRNVSATVFAGIMLALVLPQRASAQWDVATDFNPSVNGAGAWTYGSKPSVAGAFTPFTTTQTDGGNDYWGIIPVVGKNTSAVDFNQGGYQLFPAGATFFHPSALGEYAVFRFTAPATGNYSLTSAFFGLELVPGGTTSDVAVLENGASLFSAAINGFGPPSQRDYNAPIPMLAGDHLDFEVGFGADNNYYYDWTAIEAHLNVVPEPASLVLVGTGLLGLLGISRRRKVA